MMRSAWGSRCQPPRRGVPPAPARSDNGTSRHEDGGHEGGAGRRRALMLILSGEGREVDTFGRHRERPFGAAMLSELGANILEKGDIRWPRPIRRRVKR